MTPRRERTWRRVATVCLAVVGATAALVFVGPALAQAATGGPIELGVNTGKCVDRDVASGNVQLWDCNGLSNQLWTLAADGALHTADVCLQPQGGATANLTPVVVATCSGAAAQHWTRAGSTLVNGASGRCLDLRDGTQQPLGGVLQLYDCIANGANQQWLMPAQADGWTAAWASAMQQGEPLNGAANFTCRDIARVTVAGSAVRIRLSNLYDTSAVTFTAVSVAQRDTGGAVVSGTQHAVTFAGSPSVSVPAGGEVISDPVSMLVLDGEDLAVSTFIQGSADSFPNHAFGAITHYCTGLSAGAGNHVNDVPDTAFVERSTDNVAWLSGIDVAGGAGTVAVLGDSITDGVSAGIDQFNRWPDDLANRLAAAQIPLGVLNEGISAGGVVQSYPGAGDPGVVRLGRDVLQQSNITTLIVLLGTNDIAEGRTVSDITAGLADLADRAHAAGLRVVGATLLPRDGGWPSQVDPNDQFHVAAATANAERAQVNAFIRTDSHFDAVIDFDPVMADPSAPDRLRPEYWNGQDGTHPNPAGLAAMANAVDLNQLLPTHPPFARELQWGSSTKCADRDSASGRVQIWDCWGGSNQLWTWNPDTTLSTGGLCMEESPADAKIVVAACTGAADQQWSPTPDDHLVNAQSGFCLNLTDGVQGNGNQLQTYPCLSGAPNQVWTGVG